MSANNFPAAHTHTRVRQYFAGPVLQGVAHAVRAARGDGKARGGTQELHAGAIASTFEVLPLRGAISRTHQVLCAHVWVPLLRGPPRRTAAAPPLLSHPPGAALALRLHPPALCATHGLVGRLSGLTLGQFGADDLGN